MRTLFSFTREVAKQHDLSKGLEDGVERGIRTDKINTNPKIYNYVDPNLNETLDFDGLCGSRI